MNSDKRKRLLKFPCEFELKIIGDNITDFEATVVKLVKTIIPDNRVLSVKSKTSSAQHYMSTSVTIFTKSQKELDKVYLVLTKQTFIKMVL